MKLRAHKTKQILRKSPTKLYMAISGILCLAGIAGLAYNLAQASSSEYSLAGNNVVLDGQHNGSVTIKLKTSTARTYSAIQGTWSLHEVVDPAAPQTSYLSISGMTRGSSTTVDYGQNGTYAWASETDEGVLSVAASGDVLTATYTIDKNTPAGNYKISFSEGFFTYYANGADVDEEDIIAADTTITVTRETTPTCQADEELVNGKCQKKTVTCQADEELVNGKCQKKTTTCQADEELVNGKCQKKTVTCQADEELVNGKCQKKTTTLTCKADEELVNNECKKKTATITCKSDEELKDNKCVKKQSATTKGTNTNNTGSNNNGVANVPDTGIITQNEDGTSSITVLIIFTVVSFVSFVMMLIQTIAHKKISF